jgi:hypothetical protein
VEWSCAEQTGLFSWMTKRRISDVGDAIVDVVNVLSGGFCADNLQLGSVHIQSDDSARGAYTAGEFSRNLTAATADIEAHHSRANAYLIKKIKRAGLQNVTQQAKSFSTRLAAPNCISLRHS